MQRLTSENLKRAFSDETERRADFLTRNTHRKKVLLDWADSSALPVTSNEDVLQHIAPVQVQEAQISTPAVFAFDPSKRKAVFDELSVKKTQPPISLENSRAYKIVSKIPGVKSAIVRLYNAHTFQNRRLASQISELLADMQP